MILNVNVIYVLLENGYVILYNFMFSLNSHPLWGNPFIFPLLCTSLIHHDHTVLSQSKSNVS